LYYILYIQENYNYILYPISNYLFYEFFTLITSKIIIKQQSHKKLIK